jgi:hypothetical protein
VISARALAFATLEPTVWGTLWAPEGSEAAWLGFSAGGERGVLRVGFEAPDTEGAWSLEGAEAALAVAPARPPRRARDAGGRLESVDSVCAVSGYVVLDGTRHELSAPGWRSTISAGLDLDELDSFRHVAGWTRDDDLVALVSLRSRKDRGQEGDLVAASVLDPAEGPAIEDPRLSTTYAASGAPRRTGLELWFEEPSDDSEAGSDAQYPRRAGGEALGQGMEWEASGFTLQSQLLRWHTRGEEGVGVYLVGRRA